MRRLLLILLLLAGPAAAQSGYYDLERWTDSGAAVLPAKPQQWRGVIAGGLGFGPPFLGSDSFEAKVLPLAELEFRNTFFASTRKGIGAYLIRRNKFRLGVRGTLDLGRDSSDDDFLAGLPNIDPGLEVGALAEYFAGPWRFRGAVRQEVLDGHGGFLFNADIAYGGRWSRDVSLIVGLDTTVMSDSYAQSYFGVDPADARAGRPAFEAGFGIRDVGIFAQAIYDISPAFFVSADARAGLLLFDAADSPLSIEDFQFFGGAMIGYRF